MIKNNCQMKTLIENFMHKIKIRRRHLTISIRLQCGSLLAMHMRMQHAQRTRTENREQRT